MDIHGKISTTKCNQGFYLQPPMVNSLLVFAKLDESLEAFDDHDE
jgi:hypothetical protein